MTKLSVNVNKIATLRNARGGNLPNLLEHVLAIEAFGADGITVHPRPDERHIRIRDVFDIKKHIRTELNVEGYPSQAFISLMQEISPAQITLVPDPPDVLTSQAGFLVWQERNSLKDVIAQLQKTEARISVFIDPFDYLNRSFEDFRTLGIDRIELFTGTYAHSFGSKEQEQVLSMYKEVAIKAFGAGLKINAGHDLSLSNLGHFLTSIPCISEVSIGHALICDALSFGIETSVKQYLKIAHEA